jgi:ATP-dependent Clp protease ATP-binding subunit ClpA
VLQHLSSASKRAIFNAQREAKVAGKATLDPEDMALAILSDPLSEVACALEDVGASRIACCEALRQNTNGLAGPSARMPRLSVAAQRTLDTAYLLARNARRFVIRPHHLLLGTLQEPGPVANALAAKGIPLNELRFALMGIDTEADADNPAVAFVVAGLWAAVVLVVLILVVVSWIGRR